MTNAPGFPGRLAIACVFGLAVFAMVLLGIVYRRRIRFSLAGLMTAILVAALVCAGLAWHFRTIRSLQRQAEAARLAALRARDAAEAAQQKAQNDSKRLLLHPTPIDGLVCHWLRQCEPVPGTGRASGTRQSKIDGLLGGAAQQSGKSERWRR